jgi:site-specific DNA-methyltransferase (cytosine-N4-specific)
MYSVQGDLVVDPFVGTGSTSLAALGGARSSLGVDIDESFLALSRTRLSAQWSEMNRRSASRIDAHERFIAEYRASGREPKHRHAQHGYPVITTQEVDLEIPEVEWLDPDNEGFAAYHRPLARGQ